MKISVIDIGTRAIRVLIGETDRLHAHGFRFEDYLNRGIMTEAGKGIYQADDGTHHYHAEAFESTIEGLKSFLEFCRNRGVQKDHIYVIGTEIFRRVTDYRDLVDMIKQRCELQITVLAPEEEAESTFWAATISCKPYYQPDEPMIVIEQGGGSMQLTIAEVDASGTFTRYGQTSIPELGALLLSGRFFARQSESRPVGTVKHEVHEFARRKLQDVLRADFALPDRQKPRKAFALGTVITNYYDGSNRQIHGKSVSLLQLQEAPPGSKLLEEYHDAQIQFLLDDVESGHFPETLENIRKLLVQVYGQPCYAAVLEYFQLEHLRICGTGLRYGVFFRIANNAWQHVREYQR